MGSAYIANGFVVDQDGEVGTDETPVIQQKNGVNIVFTQACTASFGLLATMGDQEIVANIILKDTEKPASQTQRFVTSAPNQTSLTLRVFENDVRDQVAPVVEEQEVFETCYVQLEPGLPDSAPIDITFNISADGIIEIVATDVTRGASTTVVAVRKNSQAGEEGLDDIKSMKLG
jgi:molecular chaperone DnaK (HSP70)